ncbi:WD40-repeat-containing domain protein [Mycena belliarum]|uniref:WD40-repeat-containing domain protein n=1 Tax=Mycena belliarum TaxID=1033014 RepID=A0AAD6TV05_9AGAR|nr:WD40-repeat-containing domain protein [Mycena belliae]
MSTDETPAAKYILHGALNGHQGSVNCLRATEDGQILASGGTDGVKLWDLTTLAALARPNGAGIRGATSALVWIRREDEAGEILVYGTQIGFVVFWKQNPVAGKDRRLVVFEEASVFQMADPGEVTSLAYDAGTNRLAVCHRNTTVQVHSLDSQIRARAVFSVSYSNFLPKSIAFGETKSGAREIIAFGFHDGRILCLNGTNGDVTKVLQVGAMIGAVDYNGPALYRFDKDKEHRVKTFEVKNTKPFPRPRQVCFADDCSSIVSGSDHGVVYVFDRRTGHTMDILRVDPNDWVQTVTVRLQFQGQGED